MIPEQVEPDSDVDAARAMVITEQIKPLLAGQGPAVQSAVLANLTALWLAGHVAATPSQTATDRDSMLHSFMQLVADLVPPSEQEILDGLVGRSNPQ